jgi:hypothetical protein
MSDLDENPTDGPPPEVPPGLNLDEVGMHAYAYICHALKVIGIELGTVGIAVGVTALTYSDWIKARAKCEDKGREQVSPKTGWVSATPWAEDERRLKEELGRWLAKLGMTLQSFSRIKKDSGASGVQDDLFEALAKHGQSSQGPGLQH